MSEEPYDAEPEPVPDAWQQQPQTVEPQMAWTSAPVEIPKPLFSPFWPLVLLMNTLLFLMITQAVGAGKAQKDLEASRVSREKLVFEADKVTDSLQSLVTDLLDLAKSDEQAQAVVDKYQIKQNEPKK